jgi:hypothetical protein
VPDAPFGDRDRDRLFSLLSAHAALDHIDLEELERRVVAVSEAPEREQAEAVLADLPPLPEGLSRAPKNAPGFGGHPAWAGTGPGRPRWGRGHGDSEHAARAWTPTEERFRDPRTRRVMRVWEDAAGGRHYVPEEDN